MLIQRSHWVHFLAPVLGRQKVTFSSYAYCNNSHILRAIIGGRLIEAFGWRSTLYFMAAYAFSAWILVFFVVLETSSKKRSTDLSNYLTLETPKVLSC